VGPWDEFQLMATADLHSHTRVQGMRKIGCLQNARNGRKG
jgi:hypothetical protein